MFYLAKKTILNIIIRESKIKDVNVKQLEQRRIDVTELPKKLPDFSASLESKDVQIKKWIIDWILNLIQSKKVNNNDLLPNKSELSNYLGVSIGTVQNAIRFVEDEGYLKSKQRIGTMVSLSNAGNPIDDMRKLTTKREKIIENIQALFIERNIRVNSPVPSTRKMSEYLNVSTNTVRLAYENLCAQGILISRQTRGNDSNWILKSVPKIINPKFNQIESETLVMKIVDELKDYIKDNYNIGDKIISHEELSKMFNVSIKTVHDSICKLCDDGILLSRRGRYGTIVRKIPNSDTFSPQIENSIFASAEDSLVYHYQRIEDKIKNMIIDNYKLGDKLPSMDSLSKDLDVSTNTVRKALQNIAEQGYLKFGRGRYGGTYIIDLPVRDDSPAYQWLAVNPKFAK